MGKSAKRKPLFLGSVAVFLTVHLAAYGFAQNPGIQERTVEVRGEGSWPAQSSQAKPPDAKTSLRRFPRNLGSNFVALFSKNNLAPFVIGVAATGAATALDGHVHGYFKDRSHSTAFADIGGTMGKGYVLAPAVYGVLLAGRYSRNDRFHSYGYALAQGYAIDVGLSSAIKVAARRARPDASDHLAFPSAHASSFFMIAAVTERYYGKRAGIVGYGIATYVAVSRLAKDVHWTSDVVAGSALGYIVGRTVSRNTGITRRPVRITVVPVLDRKNKSRYLELSIGLPG